jgi:hypothetical protein
LANSNPLHVKTIEFGPERNFENQSISFCSPRGKVVQHVEGKSRSLRLELQGNEGSTPLSVYSPHIHQRRLQASPTTQRRMNPALKDIVKEELQKLLDAGFIYPISDSEWVSPLVLVPKKNGKWRICVDYRELNKATKKDHFPLPFIDQVLDGLAGKKFFLS